MVHKGVNKDIVGELNERADAYLKKAEDNRAHLSEHYAELSQSTWERVHDHDESRVFQAWELTTGQAAEITGVTVSTIAKYCVEGRLDGAYRDDIRKWWHIPASAIDTILQLAARDLADLQTMRERTKRYWIRWYTEKGQYSSNGHKGE